MNGPESTSTSASTSSSAPTAIERLDPKGRVLGWLTDNVGTMLVIGLILVVWEGYARFFNPRGNIYFPSIEHTIRQTAASSDVVLQALRVTFVEVLIAFPLAVLIGVAIGVAVSQSFLVRYLTMPLLVFAYAIPHPILAPLFLLWFGLGLEGVVAFAAWVAFFPTFLNAVSSLSRIDPEFEKFATVTGATRWQRLRYIEFWNALPEIVSGAKITFQLTIVGVIIAEFLGGGSGLGYMVIRATQRAQLGLTFGIIILIMIFASVLYKLISVGLEAASPHRR